MILHLTNCGSTAGLLKQARCIDAIASFEYSLSTDSLPRDFSNSEIKRCIKNGCWHLFDNSNKEILNINIDDYNEIIVWHSMDANSLLLLYYVCSSFKNNIYHVNVSEFYGSIRTGQCTPGQISNLYVNLEVVKRRVDKNEQLQFGQIYNSLIDTEGIPKISDGYQIIPVSKDFVKALLLKNITYYGRNYLNVIKATIVNNPIQLFFDVGYLVMLIFEMIEDKELEPIKIDKEGNIRKVRLGDCLNRKYKYNDENINDWYSFSVRKPKLDMEEYIKKFYL